MPGNASASGVPGKAQPGSGSRGSGSAGRATVTSIAEYAGVQDVVRIVRVLNATGQRIGDDARRDDRPYFLRQLLEDQASATVAAIAWEIQRHARIDGVRGLPVSVVPRNETHHSST